MALTILTTFILLFFLPNNAFSSDTQSLLKFKNSLQNTENALSSTWIESIPPCNGDHANWSGVLCYKGHVWGFKLENMNLKGTIDVESLKELPYLRTISLMNNDFDTTWPIELNKLEALKNIYLSNNKFSGEIPSQAFQGMQWLKKIYLSNNQFSGAIPTSLATLPRLIDLRLDGNKFSGPIPNFQQKLKSFNVANNQLEGEIPATLSKIPPSSFSGNQGLCGGPLSACSSSKKTSPSPSPSSSSSPINVSLIVVVVLVSLAILVIAAVILFVLIKRKKQGRQQVEGTTNLVFGNGNRDTNIQTKGTTTEDDQGSTISSRASSSNNSKKSENMKLSFVREESSDEFDLQDLLKANAEILGSGMYSSSYKAALLSGPNVVVKRFKQMNNVDRQDFQEHMRRLGRLNHPNLLPLVAYYYRREEKLLVTNFVHNGSLAVRLHGYQALGQPCLDWPTRLNIIKGVAKGLEYLYKDMPSLIAPHGHLKSSNVLLTESMEPVLTDYGLAPVINQDLAPEIMAIYKSPEYLQNGRITKKTDLWTFGILVLEILTGKFPSTFIQQGKGSELSLANWVDSVVPEKWSKEVFDKDLEVNKNSEGEMVKLLKIALHCCDGDVDKRWDLKEVIENIEEVKEIEEQ